MKILLKHIAISAPVSLLAIVFNILLFAPPEYHVSFGDPDYAYLINSLMLAEGYAPNHTDHPGTTVQTIGALVIRIAHAFFHSSQGIVDAVLENSYFYVKSISLGLAAILATSCLWLGIVLCRAGYSWWVVPATQILFFLLPTSLFFLTRVCPEILLLSVALWIGTILINNGSHRLTLKSSVLIGVALGFGLATKYTFLPLLLLLLLAGSWRALAAGTLALVGSFLMFTLPIWPHYHTAFRWIWRVAWHQGVYGSGEPGFFPSIEILQQHLIVLWNSCRIYFDLLLLIPIAFTLWSFNKKNDRSTTLPFQLLAGSLVLLLQLAMVLKHVGDRYLIPALAVWFWLLPSILQQLKGNRARFLFLALYFLVAINTLSNSLTFQRMIYNSYPEAVRRIKLFHQEAAKFTHCEKLLVTPVWAVEYGIYGGDAFAKRFYQKEIQKKFPRTLFFEPAYANFHSFGAPYSKDEIKRIFKNSKCYVLLGAPLTPANDPEIQRSDAYLQRKFPQLPFELETLYEKDFDRIYKIVRFN